MSRNDERNQEWATLYQSGLSLQAIGQRYGMTHAAVRHVLKNMGIERRPVPQDLKRLQFEPHHDEWASLYQEGVSTYEIGRRFGADALTVCRLLEARGIKRRSGADAHRLYPVGNDGAFEVIDEEPKAYWLGFLMADGNVREKVAIGTSWLLQVNLQERDMQHLVKLSQFLQVASPIGHVAKTESVYLRATSERLIRSLVAAGCTPRKSLTLQFPLANVPSHLLGHFVRGYFDGDGSVFQTKSRRSTGVRVGWSCGSLDFLHSLQTVLLRQVGVTSVRIEVPPTRSVRQLTAERRPDVERIYHWMYDGATAYLDRKKETFDRLMLG